MRRICCCCERVSGGNPPAVFSCVKDKLWVNSGANYSFRFYLEVMSENGYGNNPLEPLCSAMCLNTVQLCVSGWLRSMCAARAMNAVHSSWLNVEAKGGCHATDATATRRPDWQARLQTDVHATLWSSVSWETAAAMNTSQLHRLKGIVVSQASVCMFPHLHACARVCLGDAFITHDRHEKDFSSVDLPNGNWTKCSRSQRLLSAFICVLITFLAKCTQ